MQTKDLFHKKSHDHKESFWALFFVLFYKNSIYLKKTFGLLDISSSASPKDRKSTTIHKSMVSKVTIAIDGMVAAEPLGPMVFQWFFGQSTIGDDGFQCLPTIGPTMRW